MPPIKKIRTAFEHIRFIISVSADIITFVRLVKIFTSVVVFKTKDKRTNVAYKLSIPSPSNHKTQTIYIRYADYFIFYEIFWLKVYEPFITKLSNQSKGTILDLGGHIGLAALYFKMYSDNPIVIYEPSVKNLEILRKNVSGFPNITVETSAVGDHEGVITFYLYPDAPSRNSIISETGSRETLKEEVAVTTLDKILTKYDDVVAIKFDIEGAEESVFKLSKIASIIPVIIGEIKETEENTLQDFLKLFASHQPAVRTIGEKMHLILLTKN